MEGRVNWKGGLIGRGYGSFGGYNSSPEWGIVLVVIIEIIFVDGIGLAWYIKTTVLCLNSKIQITQKWYRYKRPKISSKKKS